MGLRRRVLIHIDLSWPTGVLETVLAALFVVVALSGFFGQWITYDLPRRLTGMDEELIFERLPVHRRKLKEMAENVVTMSLENGGTTKLPEFYLSTLRLWFSRHEDLLLHLVGSNRRLAEFDREFATAERYLEAADRELLAEMRVLVQKKHHVDMSYTFQLILKGWLLVHVPASYAMLAVAIAHGFVVHAFSDF